MARPEVPIPTTFTFRAMNDTLEVPTADMLGGNIYYCDRSDDKTKATISKVRKIAAAIVGINRRTVLPEIGEFMRTARLDADQTLYEEMRHRSEEQLMPKYGLDPWNDKDREKFYNLFENACKAAEAGRTREIEERLDTVDYDDNVLTLLEMQQESKYSQDPLSLLENILRAGNRKRSYESLYKLLSAMYIIPELMNQEQYEGLANIVNSVLTKKEVLTDTEPVTRGVLAKIYNETGECTEWVEYDGKKNTKFESGQDKKGMWKQRYVAYPSRSTSRGLPVLFTDRKEKEEGSKASKILRKMKLNDDHYAIRFVLDETKGDIKTQIQILLGEIGDAFGAENFILSIDTKSGYTNTLVEKFTTQVDKTYVEFPVKENTDNKTTSSARRVFQVDLSFTDENGKERQFELQILDTLSDLNRRFNVNWGDPAYKVTQLFSPVEREDGFKPTQNKAEESHKDKDTLASILFPPYYTQALSYPGLKEKLTEEATRRVVNQKRHNTLPREY